MALVKGDSGCTTGLSKRIFDARWAARAAIGLGDTAGAIAAKKADAYAIAGAVVDEITENAMVLPALLVAPPGGGPVTGTGTVT